MYWSALILGFIGSTHCVVMCGPISLAMQGQGTLGKFLMSRLLYNSGRILTYAAIGLLFGIVGQWVALAQYQQSFSIVLGVVMLALGFTMITQWINFSISPILSRLVFHFKSWMSNWMNKKSLLSALTLGVVNGFLPCGLVYAALVGALATAHILDGMWYMVVFGLGTIPAMLMAALVGKVIKAKWLSHVTQFSSFFVLLLGLLLVLRGMNLNIPYISPLLSYLYPNGEITICR